MNADKTKSDKSEAADVGTPVATGEIAEAVPSPRETNGPKGLEPTRYGDWEQKGRCTDF